MILNTTISTQNYDQKSRFWLKIVFWLKISFRIFWFFTENHKIWWNFRDEVLPQSDGNCFSKYRNKKYKTILIYLNPLKLQKSEPHTLLCPQLRAITKITKVSKMRKFNLATHQRSRGPVQVPIRTVDPAPPSKNQLITTLRRASKMRRKNINSTENHKTGKQWQIYH